MTQKTFQQHKNWLLRALPEPEWIPDRWTTAVHKETGKPVLVVTQPIEPEEIYELPEDAEQRPMYCNVLLGEELLENIDLVELRPA